MIFTLFEATAVSVKASSKAAKDSRVTDPKEACAISPVSDALKNCFAGSRIALHENVCFGLNKLTKFSLVQAVRKVRCWPTADFSTH
jgi:hypothetical protein